MSLEQQLAQLRIPLLRYASLQLRCDALAEDAVSETLLAILEKPDAYAGASSLRTYATGISSTRSSTRCVAAAASCRS